MKTSIARAEARALTRAALDAEVKNLRQELFNLRSQVVRGELRNVSRLREVHKQIARLLTIARERELADQAGAGAR